MPLSCAAIPGLCLRETLESDEATKLIAWYTFVLHLLIGFYFLDIHRGNVSDWIPSPIFEYSKDDVRTWLALSFAIFSFAYMLFASLGLLKGLKTKIRIYYLPWLWLTVFEIIAVFYHSIWLIFRYPYDTSTIVTAVVVIIYTLYHSYLYLIVLSNYNFLFKIQNPTLIFTDGNPEFV